MTAAITSLATPFPASPLRLAGRPAPLLSGPFARQLRTGRQFLEARSAGPAAEDLASTAWPALDRLLCGGLRRGALVELVGPTSSGRFSLVLGALAAATRRAEPAALVDLGDGLEPRLAEAAGIELDRLLWVRPRHLREALATETILGAGLPLVALDLGLPPIPGGGGVEAFWLRLARTAQSRQVALLVASPYRVSGTAAAAVVEASERRVLWRGQGAAPRVLAGLRCRLGLTKGNGWQNAEPEELLLRLDGPLAAAAETAPVAPVAAPAPIQQLPSLRRLAIA